MKLLLWSAVVLMVVVWMFRTKKISSDSLDARADTGKTQDPGSTDTSSAGDAAEPMLPCAHCGVHVPASEVVTSSSGAVFCSQEHRLQHGDGK
ncbi:MAG TPA: PP0621 family protein [Noviherbaspirillum sp.]|nr:PP0621 family protein [Noviherbaspirillum sp.]